MPASAGIAKPIAMATANRMVNARNASIRFNVVGTVRLIDSFSSIMLRTRVNSLETPSCIFPPGSGHVAK